MTETPFTGRLHSMERRIGSCSGKPGFSRTAGQPLCVNVAFLTLFYFDHVFTAFRKPVSPLQCRGSKRWKKAGVTYVKPDAIVLGPLRPLRSINWK